MMKNTPTLSLRVPEPSGRPGDAPDFSHLKLDAAGAVTRPEVSTTPYEMRDHAFQLVRVLDDEGQAVGPWNPKLDPEILRRGLKAMILTRAFDDRMHRAHRQGKTSFYMKCTGEEAEKWPLGDPIERLKQHLIVLGEWSDDQPEAAEKDAVEQVRAAAKESEAIGTLGQSRPSVKTMFEEVFATEDWRLVEQRREVGV